MKKLRLTAPISDLQSLLQRLIVLGAVDIAEPLEMPEISISDSPFAQIFGDAEPLQTQLAELECTLDRLHHHTQKRTTRSVSPCEIDESSFFDEANLTSAAELAAAINRADERLSEIPQDEQRERDKIAALTPWAAYDLPLEFSGTRTTGIILGSVTAKVDFAEVESAIANAAETAQVMKISETAGALNICVIFTFDIEDTVKTTLWGFDFSQYTPQDMLGTAAENIAEAHTCLNELATERTTLDAQLSDFAKRCDDLHLAIALLEAKIAFINAAGKLSSEEYTFSMTAWVPEFAERELVEILGGFALDYELTFASEDADAPIMPSENGLARLLSRGVAALLRLFGKSPRRRRFTPFKISNKHINVVSK